METPQQPTVPAVQIPTGSNSNMMVQSLAAALNPQSAQALATVEKTVTAPPSETAPLATPAEPALDLTKPEPTKPTPKEAPKKGLEGLLEGADEKTTEPEAKPEQSDLPPDATTPEAKNAWSVIKSKVKALENEKQTWEKEKADLLAKTSDAKLFNESDPKWQEFQKAQERLKELEPVVARVAYQKTPAYIETVKAPRDEIGVAAKQLADQFKIADAKMVAALTETDPSRQNELLTEVSAEMDERGKSRLYRYADRLEELNQLDERMSQNAEKAYQEAEAIELQKQKQATLERKAEEMRAIEDVRPKLQKVAHLFKLEGETDADAVARVIQESNEVPFDEQDTPSKAFSVIAANLVPRMQRLLSEERKTNAALRKEIAELSGATPRVSGGEQIPATATQGPTDMMSALKAQLAQTGYPV